MIGESLVIRGDLSLASNDGYDDVVETDESSRLESRCLTTSAGNQSSSSEKGTSKSQLKGSKPRMSTSSSGQDRTI